MNYNTYLQETYGDMEINLVKNDTGPAGLPCYIEAVLGHDPKDKGRIHLELLRYLFRLGFRFHWASQYQGEGKNTTIRYYMTWNDIDPLQSRIAEIFNRPVLKHFLPSDFDSLPIQNGSLGIHGEFLPGSQHSK